MADNSEDYDPSKDPTRKAKSADPSWKCSFWLDIRKEGIILCILCNKKMHSVRRLKQHLASGYSNIAMCTKTTPEIIQGMKDHISRRCKKNRVFLDDDNANSDDG